MSRLLLLVLMFATALPFRLAAAQDSKTSGKPEPTRAESNRAESAQRDPAAGNYVLQPLDFIKIQINGEPDLNREMRISQEGKIDLPFIRVIDLKSKTVAEAEDLIRKRYDADYLVNPQVNVTVVEYAPRSVEIFGQVGSPGIVYFPKEEGLTLTGAISRSGSFTRLANKKAVTLKRTYSDGRPPETFKIDVDAMTKGDSADAWPLQPGDVITVPEKIL